MTDEMFQAMMIPVFVAAAWLLIVKPLAWVIRNGITRARNHRAGLQRRR